MLKLGFLASGGGTNFQAIIDRISAGELNAKAVLLISDKSDSYALKRAEKHGIAYKYMPPKDHPTKDAYFAAIAQEMKAAGVELVVLAGFMRIVSRALLAEYPMKVINIHPALLPSFPGLHGQGQAADYGVRISGCTVHFVDEGMDTGPVIIQAAVPVLPGDTEEAVSARILKAEHRIFPEAIRLVSEGRLRVEGRRVMVSGYDAKDVDGVMFSPPLGC